VNEDEGLLLILHHEAVDLAMGIENEAFDGARDFRQASWIDPMHILSFH
jgi:hypothetical protein